MFERATSSVVEPSMRKRFLSSLLALSVLVSINAVRAADEGLAWQTNYKAALKEAATSHKPILADFTGSDWCGWCIKLASDTFSKPEFAKFAKEKLVLLEVDDDLGGGLGRFPRLLQLLAGVLGAFDDGVADALGGLTDAVRNLALPEHLATALDLTGRFESPTIPA